MLKWSRPQEKDLGRTMKRVERCNVEGWSNHRIVTAPKFLSKSLVPLQPLLRLTKVSYIYLISFWGLFWNLSLLHMQAMYSRFQPHDEWEFSLVSLLIFIPTFLWTPPSVGDTLLRCTLSRPINMLEFLSDLPLAFPLKKVVPASLIHPCNYNLASLEPFL